MSVTTRLDISIGPVQGFVAQSRRTRDLWGSSYLLSFLVAHAMRGARISGGKIIQPVVDEDPLYRWVSGQRDGNVPQLGSLPNHFVVEVEEDVAQVANAALDSLNAAWHRVCDAVWERYLGRVWAAGDGTEIIWNRQVNDFWEVTWTAGATDEPGGLLARRKFWRSHRPSDEPGDKCTVMHDLQEISGYVRAASTSSRQRQDEFWRSIQRGLSSLELRDNERLSAIAFVKRLFPLVSNQALGWDVDRSRWPSTAHIAARTWMRKVHSAAHAQAADFASKLLEHSRTVTSTSVNAEVSDIDPDYLHRGSLANERVCPLDEGVPQDVRAQLMRLLDRLYETADETGQALGAPPRFYALLLADGDRLGRLVGKLGGAEVGRALSEFTEAVPNIVRDHDGETVYAGGDDVLAMLPVENALECAAQLENRYRTSFTGAEGGTLSAAVVFAQVRQPLSSIIALAHHLLDDIAKEDNGRNSLAVGVLKASGLYCQWVTNWNRKLPDGGEAQALIVLETLTRHFRNMDSDSAGLSVSLLYRARDTLSRLCGWERWAPGDWGALPAGVDIRPFLHAEVSRSLSATVGASAAVDAEVVVTSVWNLLSPARSDVEDNGTSMSEAGVDALLLARFVADPRREEDTY